MRSLVPPSHGFVANTHESRSTRTHRNHHRGLLVLVVFALALLVATQSLRMHLEAGVNSEEDSTAVAVNNIYRFKVFGLNQTSVQFRAGSTVLSFKATDFPMSIGSLSFGDFRADSTFKGTYYACSGILMNASGSNAAITIRESTGKLIGNVDYHGQNPIVFGSMAWSTTDPGKRMYDGTDLLVLDWRGGNWTPTQGIVVEHPSNVTLNKAVFFMMVFAPGLDQDIPEFELIGPALFVGMLMLFWHRRRISPGRSRPGLA